MMRLTSRQHDLLQFAAQGLSLAEAGEQLHITRDTAKRHMAGAFLALGAHSQAHAVALAIGAGMIDAPGPTADMLA